MAAYNYDIGLSMHILYSTDLAVGEKVEAPSSSQDWDGKTPIKEGDLVSKPGFWGPEWYSLVPRAPRQEKENRGASRDWHLGHREDW